MQRYDQAPIHLYEQTKRLSDKGPTWSFNVTPEGGKGTMKTPQSGISLLCWPAGWTQPWGKHDQFEYHTLHEEIFFLAGTMNFDNRYIVKTLGYINHPPFWRHATNFWATKDGGDMVMLMRSGMQPIVQLDPIPENWDGHPYFAPPTRNIGTRSLQVDDVPAFPLITKAGLDTGIKAKRIAEDRDSGYTTWVMEVPAGWAAKGPRMSVPGGDEIYVIKGDLNWGGSTPGVLKTSGYVCDASKIQDGAGALSSKGGAQFVRWTKNGHDLWNVYPQV